MDVKLRPARFADCELLYLWRVDGETNDWYSGRKVEWDAHREWFTARLNNPLVRIWVAEVDGTRVGSCREDSQGELSYHVDPHWQGRGVGTAIVQEAVKLSSQHRLKAVVDHGNVGGAKVALAAGFEYRPDVDFYLLRR